MVDLFHHWVWQLFLHGTVVFGNQGVGSVSHSPSLASWFPPTRDHFLQALLRLLVPSFFFSQSLF